MNILTKGAAALGLGGPLSESARSHGKVLVVMSSAHELDLRDGKKYSTG